MKESSIMKEKSFSLSTKIIHICRYLKGKKNSNPLTTQLFRSGTSVGALIREAEFAQSKPDFINKMSVALKEANETDYWLNVLKESGDIDHEMFASVNNLSKEIIRLLVATVKTAKKNGLERR